MRKMPNFVLLRTFEAAARLQSFALAGKELHLTPSTISHQVKELEQYFGRALFLRRNRQVEPTREALRLLDSLSRVLDVVEAACAEVHLAPDAQVLAVHAAPSFAVKWLGPRLTDFAQTHPDITIRLSTSPEPIDLTREHEIDVSISYGIALERPGIQTLPLGGELILPLCAPELLQVSDASPAQRICELTLIDSQLSRLKWTDWFTANHLEMPQRPQPSFDRAALAIAAATDGMGVVLESALLAARELARGELIEIYDPAWQRFERPTHFLSCRDNEASRGKVQAFTSWICEKIGVSLKDVSV